MDIEDIFNYDFRRFDTEHALSSVRTYIRIMTAQMDEAHRLEMFALEEEGPDSREEEDYDTWQQVKSATNQLYEEQLRPALYYSFVTLIQTIYETRLKAFCSSIKSQCHIAIESTDLRGTHIDQARVYLEKLAGLPVSGYPEWAQLLPFQRVRNCIVHSNGYVKRRDGPELRAVIAKGIGLSLDGEERLVVTQQFCDEFLTCVDGLFQHLFDAAGWISGKKHGPKQG